MVTLRHQKVLFSKAGQAATELAIFGAIVLFIVGLIFRSGLNANQSMNYQLRAMRFALAESYRTAEGVYRAGVGNPSGARNTANVLIVEDRLAGDIGQKLGSRDRTPFVTTGMGTFSKNLFLTLDLGEAFSLPVYDVIVNGQRFPFLIANFRRVVLARWNGSQWVAPVMNGYTVPNCGAAGTGYGTDLTVDDPLIRGKPYGICWEPSCFTAGPWVVGCLVMLKKAYNYPLATEWCNGVAGACTTNMDADHRFDLNFDGTPDVLAGDFIPTCDGTTCSTKLRERFAWQWFKVAGVSERGTLIGLQGIRIGHDDVAPVNHYVDVDGDTYEEIVYAIYTNPEAAGAPTAASVPAGLITAVDVLDYQAGDIDFTQEDIGLQKSVNMISVTGGDPENPETATAKTTYLHTEEGHLFSGSKEQYQRTTTKFDHVDLIERRFRISNDTGRFCANGKPRPWHNAAWGAEANWRDWQGLNRLVNPVEACAEPGIDCFSPVEDKRYLTCFDPNHSDGPTIFIRSRLTDLRGRRWVTRVDPQGKWD